jgi:hypothetical protein
VTDPAAKSAVEAGPAPGPGVHAPASTPWSDAELTGLHGDASELRSQAILDHALTVAVFLALVVAATVGVRAAASLVAGHSEPPWPLGLVVWGLSFSASMVVAAWRAHVRADVYAAAARLRDPALRACVHLLDAGRITRPANERLAVEGWRAGLPVELSTSIHLSPVDDDEIVARVGAPPGLRRPRVVTRADLFGASSSVPGPLGAWKVGRPEASALADDLARRFSVSVAWGPDGVELRGPSDHRLLRPDRVEALLAAAVELAGACGLVAASAVRLASGSSERQAWCPYCRDALEVAPTTACGGCGTAHHALCLAEHGRCTVFGCGRRQARPGVLA